MSYQHPDYDSSRSQEGWLAFIAERDFGTVKKPDVTVYYASVAPDNSWCSVDGDEWYGEFPSVEAAEDYLNIKFRPNVKYDE